MFKGNPPTDFILLSLFTCVGELYYTEKLRQTGVSELFLLLLLASSYYLVSLPCRVSVCICDNTTHVVFSI